MATNGNMSHQEQAPGAAPSADGSAASSSNNLRKDEVGWYFVEQYYTTLSKNQEKLHVCHCSLEALADSWLTS
jgi:hypothetical protein